MNKYHIRYNTRHGESDLVWRIFKNGIQKWNICCIGKLTMEDGKAEII